MTAIFDTLFALIVNTEGGYTSDPRDPGGETKYGISKRAYPTLDIAALTLDGAKEIYLRDYWTPIHGDDLPPSLALIVFDAAVNNGVPRSVEWLQTAAEVTTDGVIGPVTLAAVKARPAAKLCTEALARRIDFMARDPDWRTFGLGWARRLTGLAWEATKFGT